MKSLFAPSERRQILDRFGRLQAGATRQWGKMDPAQTCAHCTGVLMYKHLDHHLRQFGV